jgi:hypothetical protein
VIQLLLFPKNQTRHIFNDAAPGDWPDSIKKYGIIENEWRENSNCKQLTTE